MDGVTPYTVHWTGVAFLVYGTVAALLFVGGLVRYGLFRRRTLRWSSPAGVEDLAALEEQKKAVGLDRAVELYRCPLVHTPLLMGFLHPVILLPEGMSQGSLDTALAHELTHLKGHDTAQLLWASLARAVYWFNPMVWLLVRQFRREVELCCDYTLLKDQDEAGRRAYGQAILDQMAAGDRGLSRLTTGFSGDKKEVFARFRAMMDATPKRRGRAALAAACAVVVLAGGLVGCRTETAPTPQNASGAPEGDGAWITGVDLEERTVTYYPLSQALIADGQALEDWIWGEDGMAAEEPRTVPLREDVQFFHTYTGEVYSIPADTLRFSLSMTQAGALGEVALEEGEAQRVQLASPAYLDLSAADLDFTGWCGEVFVLGAGSAILSSRPYTGIVFSYDGGETITIDPAPLQGEDGDHSTYTLPVSPELAQSWTPPENPLMASGYRLTLVNGTVTGIEALALPGAEPAPSPEPL